MADHPIIMSAPMVHATKREAATPGTGKGMTRRLFSTTNCKVLGNRVSPKSPAWTGLDFSRARVRAQSTIMLAMVGKDEAPYDLHLDVPWKHPDDDPEDEVVYRVRPIYGVGDRLWVKENWRTLQKADCLKPNHLANDPSKITYEADPERRNPLWAFGKLRPSLFLPRWASRITLIVTAVKIERLQAITQADAIAEGIEGALIDGRLEWRVHPDDRLGYASSAVGAFYLLWTKLHGPKSWDANPWVIAISFKPVLANIDTLKEAA